MGRHSHRAPSVADSMAEYFDANEVIVCESSSEAEASDESGLSDITTTSTSEPEEGLGEGTIDLHHSDVSRLLLTYEAGYRHIWLDPFQGKMQDCQTALNKY